MPVATIKDLFESTVRYFPLAVGATMAIGGIATAHMPWVLTSVGAILLAGVVGVLQYSFYKVIGWGPEAGDDVLRSCGMIPLGPAAYSVIPSFWFSLTSFLATVIITNAASVAAAPPAKSVSAASFPVQNRKSIGALSIIITVALLLFLAIARFTHGGCETMTGAAIGILLGSLFGWAWWNIISAGNKMFGDVHGVASSMIPASLRSSAKACTSVP